MQCTKLAEIEGNLGDQISTLIFRNVKVEGVTIALKNQYTDVILENLKVNGTVLTAINYNINYRYWKTST